MPLKRLNIYEAAIKRIILLFIIIRSLTECLEKRRWKETFSIVEILSIPTDTRWSVVKCDRALLRKTCHACTSLGGDVHLSDCGRPNKNTPSERLHVWEVIVIYRGLHSPHIPLGIMQMGALCRAIHRCEVQPLSPPSSTHNHRHPKHGKV